MRRKTDNNNYKTMNTDKLSPMDEVDELSYAQKINYKWRIFETICRDANLSACHDVFINNMLERTDHIYEELTKINN